MVRELLGEGSVRCVKITLRIAKVAMCWKSTRAQGVLVSAQTLLLVKDAIFIPSYSESKRNRNEETHLYVSSLPDIGVGLRLPGFPKL